MRKAGGTLATCGELWPTGLAAPMPVLLSSHLCRTSLTAASCYRYYCHALVTHGSHTQACAFLYFAGELPFDTSIAAKKENMASLLSEVAHACGPQKHYDKGFLQKQGGKISWTGARDFGDAEAPRSLRLLLRAGLNEEHRI